MKIFQLYSLLFKRKQRIYKELLYLLMLYQCLSSFLFARWGAEEKLEHLNNIIIYCRTDFIYVYSLLHPLPLHVNVQCYLKCFLFCIAVIQFIGENTKNSLLGSSFSQTAKVGYTQSPNYCDAAHERLLQTRAEFCTLDVLAEMCLPCAWHFPHML